MGSGSLITFPNPAVLRLSADRRQRLQHGGSGARHGQRRDRLSPRAAAAGRGFLLLVALAVAGGLTGALVLLALPSTTFEVVVPFLILIASGLMAVQPYLSRALAARRGNGRSHGLIFDALIYLTSIYGGYFGAAQGVLFISLLSIFQPGNLQRSNAVKNVLASVHEHRRGGRVRADCPRRLDGGVTDRDRIGRRRSGRCVRRSTHASRLLRWIVGHRRRRRRPEASDRLAGT